MSRIEKTGPYSSCRRSSSGSGSRSKSRVRRMLKRSSPGGNCPRAAFCQRMSETTRSSTPPGTGGGGATPITRDPTDASVPLGLAGHAEVRQRWIVVALLLRVELALRPGRVALEHVSRLGELEVVQVPEHDHARLLVGDDQLRHPFVD